MRVTKATKEKLYQQQKGKCAICQQADVPLEVTQRFFGNEDDKFDISNLMLLCPNCHSQVNFRDFREIDLINYLAILISHHPEFKNINQEVQLGSDSSMRADIIADGVGGDRYIIEVKSMLAYAPSRTDGLLMMLSHYKSLQPSSKIVFAFPGLFSESLLDMFSSQGIIVWDQKVIASKFKEQIIDNPHPLFSQLFGAPISTRDEDKLSIELSKIRPGKEDWYKYEKLISRILDFLFSKTLSTPITNRSTNNQVNRRDIILPNYCEHGFWKHLRSRYNADYIVVDAKNYDGLVSKGDILQISNYLKLHGTGLFGLIITRHGEDNGSLITRKDHWTVNNKLIIVLNDDDLKAMLSSNHPEEIIKQRIEDFRLDL